jgi:SAM-dependent methyltransferase
VLGSRIVRPSYGLASDDEHVTDTPTFHTVSRANQRDQAPWAQFSYVGKKLHELVHNLVAQADLESGATVLDYGCADSPYRIDLPEKVTYIGADLAGNPHADIELRSDGSVPLDEGSADLVLSTQVLEHVDDPNLYLAESFRVLRPGGNLVLSTHGIMYYHRDPEDHWRWTRTGLHKIVAAQGFEVAEMRGLMGIAAAALQIFQDGTVWKVPRVLRRPYFLLMQSLIRIFDRFYAEDSRVDNGLVIAVRATKPNL